MRIDPLVVAVGVVLCAIPILFGLLIAWWRLPYVREARREEAWRQRGMRDEGDLFAMAHEEPFTHCHCPACIDRRFERQPALMQQVLDHARRS